jgi:Domain of unknown function (DUF4440)
MHKKHFVLFVFVLTLPVAMIAQTNVETQLLALQQQRFEAMIAQDTVTLKKILSDDLTYVHSNGLEETKTTHLHSIGQKKIVYQSLLYDVPTKVVVRKKTAILTGTVHVKGLFGDTPFDMHLLFTAIYVSEQRTWRLWRWQSTKKIL